MGDVIGVSLTGAGQMDFGVPVSREGAGVGAAVDRSTGSSFTLDVFHPLGTDPYAVLAMPQSAAAGPAAASPAKCSDGAYSFWTDTPPGQAGSRKVLVESSYGWHSNLNSAPASLSHTKVLAGWKRAAAAISNTSSTCDTRDLNPKPQAYLGDGAIAGNAKQSSCTPDGSTDGLNSLVFGPLTDPTYLAVACHWMKQDSPKSTYWLLKEADVRFRSSGYSWKFADETCATGFSLVGVATHELGHVYGMGHVDESTHGNLTMSTATAPCEFGMVNLGTGDVSGIAHLYGTAY